MTEQNIFWGSNIKYLRNRKKLSQDELSGQLGISRSKLNAHENGQSVNPTLNDLLDFSLYFKMSIDTLLKVNLAVLSELKLRDLEAGNDVYITGTKIRVLAITVDKEDKEQVEYVPVKAKAGYRKGYSDPEFIAGLPRFSMPNLPANGTFRMFPITGDSMLPVPEGSDIITRYIEDWTTVKKDTPCIVILKGEQEFVFKLVTNFIEQDRALLLRSLNEQYAPYYVPVSEVLELWQYQGHYSRQLPAPEPQLQQLMRKVEDIEQAIKGLGKNKERMGG
jgi:transcriptional regulator with XRE-family HTH domain